MLHLFRLKAICCALKDALTGMTSPSPSLFCSSPVLPPIITNEKDRQFLAELNDWTQCEISKINELDTEQCYAVYREVFSKVSLCCVVLFEFNFFHRVWISVYFYSALFAQSLQRCSEYAPCLMWSNSLPATHTFCTRKGRTIPETLHPQRITRRCCSFYRPRKDGNLSRAVPGLKPRTSITLHEWTHSRKSWRFNQLS
jgi:hypothetical protein